MLEELAKLDSWNRRTLLALFAVFGIPESLIDFGCGTGAMVNLARTLGVRAVGLDIDPGPGMLKEDLGKYVDLNEQFAVGLCIEVAEHINGDRSDWLLDTVGRHIQAGGHLIWTAATPGQGGVGHVNEMPPVHWRDRLYKRNFEFDRNDTILLTAVWNWTTGPQHHLPANVMVFHRVNHTTDETVGG